MANSSEGLLILGLLFSLLASSTVIAFIANDYADSPPCTIGTDCAPIELALVRIPGTSTITGQDFTNSSGYNQNISTQGGAGMVFGSYGEWEQQDGVGYVLTQGPGWLEGDPLIIARDVSKTQGVTIVNYLVDNVPNGDFYITPRRLGDGRTKYDIKLTFSSDGIHVAKFPTFLPTDLKFTPIADVQHTEPGGSLYQVRLDEKTSTVTIIKDGVQIYDEGGMPQWDNDIEASKGGLIWYGGCGSHEVGFILKSFPDTDFSYVSPDNRFNYEVGGFWQGLIGWTDKMIPGLGSVIEMASMIGRVIAWQLPQEIMPLWLSAIIIGPQEAALVYLIARLFRGGG